MGDPDKLVYKHSKVRDHFEGVRTEVGDSGVRVIKTHTQGIAFSDFPFGVVGVSLERGYDQARDSAIRALQEAEHALDDWAATPDAWKKNFDAAHDASDPYAKLKEQLAKMQNASTPKMPSMPSMNAAAGPGMPGGLPTGVDPNKSIGDLINSTPDANVPGGINTPDPKDLANAGLNTPGVGSVNPDDLANRTKMPDMNGLGPKPDGTELADYNSPKIPSAGDVPGVGSGNFSKPGLGSSLGPGGGVGGIGAGAGGLGAGAPGAAGAPRMPGAGGMGGMPFMPMAPGAGGGKDERDRNADYVESEEGAWEDEDLAVAPAVLTSEEPPIQNRRGRAGT